jgi:RsiW-degrading membrane proteinase PrsW (M82 family)
MELFQPWHLLLLLLVAIPVLALHFLPSILAGVRHAKNTGWILVINFLLGWTIIGWVVALIWALRDTPRSAGPVAQPPYAQP